MPLRDTVFAAVRWTSLSTICRTALNFVRLIIIARFLEPYEMGLIAIVFSVLAIFRIFTDAGVSNAIIHFQNISDRELSGLYWLNVTVSIVLALFVSLLSIPIAQFFEASELVAFICAASATFVITSLGRQLQVVAQKNLKFAAISIIEIAAVAIGFAVTLIWITIDASIWAVIAGMLASSGVTTALSWALLSNGWSPVLAFNFKELGRFLRFGAYTLGNNFINSISCELDIYIGGRLLTPDLLGFYSLPRNFSLRISNSINPIVTRVALPVMAKSQDDTSILREIYLKIIRMTSSVNLPLYLGLFFYAEEIIGILFGAKWHASIPLLKIFALVNILRAITNPTGSLIYASGRVDLSFKWNLVMLFLITPALIVGSHWGPIGMSIAQLMLLFALYIPTWWFLVRPLCGAGLLEYSMNILIPLLAALAALAPVRYLLSNSAPFGPWIDLCLGIIFSGMLYLILSWLINRAWLISVQDMIFPKKQPAQGGLPK